jgi:ATP-dependent DNA helicase RecG
MALPINVHQLLAGMLVESDRIEYKQGWNPEVILRSICAFANDLHNVGGGYVIVGISELNGVAQLPPTGLPAASLDNIQKELLKICHFIQPDYFPVVSVELIDDKYVLVIWCPPGQHRPYKAPSTLGKKDAVNKPYYVRRMSSTVIAKGIDEEQLLTFAAHQRTPFDNQINHQASLDDISMVHVTNFLSEVDSNLLQDVPKSPKSDLFRQMQIAAGANENLHPLNIGLLMFADKPHKFFRGARIELVQYFDDIGDKFQETYFEGPVWRQLQEALNVIKSQIIKEQVVKRDYKAEAERCFNYPFAAIEEALANAVFHKGYDKQNPIEVSVRLDRIEITNFPGPLPPVNTKMLQQERVISRDTRNSRLGDFLKELDLTEGRGTGIRKIRSQMQRNGSPPPNFITDDDNVFFMTELLIHPSFEPVSRNDTVNDTVNDTATKVKPDLAPVQKAIVEMIIHNPDVTIQQMTQQIGKSESTIKRHIKQLQKQEIIHRTGSDKVGQWKLVEGTSE